MKKLVIFDLDGTLLNTIADLAAAVNYSLRQLGINEHPQESYPFFVGNGVTRLFERALPATLQNEEWVEKVRSHFLPYYDAHNADLTSVYPGIKDLLHALKDKKMLLAVASNKYQSATEKLIRHYFPEIDFVCILGQRQGVPVKPDPSIVHSCIEAAKVTPEEVLYVGDSGVDMQTAANANVQSVGVTWGFRPVAELQNNGACYLANQPADILQLLVEGGK